MINRITALLLFIGLAWGHNGRHQFFTPYISPGIQFGFNGDKTLFLSCQLTIGTGVKFGDHFEDTAPLFLGTTIGIRGYFQKEKPVVVYKYYDTQISFMVGGIGTGKLINNKGQSFKKNKYWIGAFGLLSYEKVHFTDKIEKQYGLFGVLPITPMMLESN